MSGWIQVVLWVLGGVALVTGALVVAGYLFSPLTVFNALVPKEGGVVVERDIAYGPHVRHRLDIYRPENSEALPVLFFGYGGGWDSGSKDDYGFVGHAFAARGYVTIIADYRLVPEVVYPDFIADTALALGFAAENIASHGGDAGRLFLMGHSAGAYNVAMLALDPAYRDGRVSVAGLIGISGPYDFYPFDVEASRNAFGRYPDPARTQPVNLVSEAAPPTLLIHGEGDRTVRTRNATALNARLNAIADGRSRVQLYPGASHADTLLALAMPLRWRYRVLEDALAFMEERL